MNCEKTNYSKTYGFTYWGGAKHASVEIITNRNEFVKKYGVKKIVRQSTRVYNYLAGLKKQYDFLDHVEIYGLENYEHIILIYVYGKLSEPTEWVSIPNMYDDGCYSYIMNVKKLTLRK